MMAYAYDNPTKIFNVSFQKLFDKFDDLDGKMKLATKSGPLVARGENNGSGNWILSSKMKPLEDEKKIKKWFKYQSMINNNLQPQANKNNLHSERSFSKKKKSNGLLVHQLLLNL